MRPPTDESLSVPGPEAQAPAAPDGGIAAEMATLYDHYFASHDYRKRYPRPNRATLRFLLDRGAGNAGRVLDYGCGDGRYGLPLLQLGAAHLTGYDISHAAIAQFASFLKDTPQAARATLYCGESAILEGTGGYDMILLLFGVLSHVGDRDARIAALRQMRRLIRPGGQLILTVPSVFRRRPLELLRAQAARARGRATGTQKEPGNVFFTRTVAHAPHRFFYHLYSVASLHADLAEAGFVLREASPESILPEWVVTQSALLGQLDAALLPLLPAALGYGIRAVAQPA
ncbi:methyltransferase domain-containing protein [Caenimonas terrae]|uniref:Methyltransferase domain-containing protein n=1 Tax=Caenimonas terrae TaxID=696074 RepID=A0ABW0NBN1_9BURK